MQVALLCPGDDFVDIGTNFLSTCLNRLDTVVGKQCANQTLLHSTSVASISAKLTTLLVVPHLISPIASN